MNRTQMKSEIEDWLLHLHGLRLTRVRDFCGTRHFEFNRVEEEASDATRSIIGVECPWRLELDDRIITGFEDYSVTAQDDELSGDEVTPMGHLQDLRLSGALGEIVDGDVVVTEDLVVEASKADRLGGFEIVLSRGRKLAVFPASASEMEWIFLKSAGRPSMMLIKGSIEFVGSGTVPKEKTGSSDI